MTSIMAFDIQIKAFKKFKVLTHYTISSNWIIIYCIIDQNTYDIYSISINNIATRKLLLQFKSYSTLNLYLSDTEIWAKKHEKQLSLMTFRQQLCACNFYFILFTRDMAFNYPEIVYHWINYGLIC